ncbi:endonuclease/exonuclease/phosphatase family protein [Lederbergia lenta]|uniref:endonuclease/exonuclease/phosphatase family protein n=1 Tax=Lederbergia lenta TaxID=1467 RepID=UPI002041FF98|nr:endonuclease/exonuclease/phosphatase family protein [Lederbergia lenta]MCM3110856.1 endonuclease/exonuclease/phosphatase family protein [Lederbergia lenta]
MDNRKNLRIMTYNLRNNSDVPPNSWAERKELILELLERETPDIIGTQECMYEQVQDMNTMLTNYDTIGLGRDGGSKGEFMAIFFKKNRLKVLAYNHFWLSDTPDTIASCTWGNDVTRMVTWIRFQDIETGQQFYHLNTHLDHISVNARVKGAELILKKVSTFNPDLPIIITGDFNTESGSEPHQVFLEKGTFIDTWDVATDRINKDLGTFNDFKDPTGGEERIDWILVRGNMQIGVIKIINDQVNGLFPSDHFPVMVDLHFTKNNGLQL